MAEFEILAWATTRRNMAIGLANNGYVTLWEGETQVLPANLPADDNIPTIEMRPIPGLQIVEQTSFGAPIATPGVYVDGVEITPPVLAPGYHVNGRVFGALAAQMTWQLPQTYAEAAITPPAGKDASALMPIWQRTHALMIHPTLEFMNLPPNAAKGAYRNPVLSEGQVYFYDAEAVNSRHNVWA